MAEVNGGEGRMAKLLIKAFPVSVHMSHSNQVSRRSDSAETKIPILGQISLTWTFICARQPLLQNIWNFITGRFRHVYVYTNSGE